MSGGGSSVVIGLDGVQDDGTPIGNASAINFVGSGVQATLTGALVTVTIPGGGSGIDTQDEGVTEGTGQSTLNFVGAGVSVASVGLTTTVTIPGGGGGGSGNSYMPGGW